MGAGKVSQPLLCAAQPEKRQKSGNKLGTDFCFLLSHPGKEDGKFPLSLSLVPKREHGFPGGNSAAWVRGQLAGHLGHPGWRLGPSWLPALPAQQGPLWV